jgi:hypothetical protein
MTNSPRRAFRDLAVIPEPPPEPEQEVPPASLFGANDAGTLRPETRRALVRLVQGPCVMRDRTSNLWTALENDERAIRQGLGDLFLELVIDREQGIAFVRNMRTDEEVPKVIRSTPLTLIDTALVLFLRERLLRADGRAFVGRDEIDDQLSVYGQATGTDAVGLGKRVNASVEKMKKNSVLQATDEDSRFEISPVLRMVFDADEVAAVTAEMQVLLQAGDRLVEDDEDAMESAE